FSSRAAASIRSRVDCGIRRAPGVLFRTAEIVPGVSPVCSATVRSVTLACFVEVSIFVSIEMPPALVARISQVSTLLTVSFNYGYWGQQGRRAYATGRVNLIWRLRFKQLSTFPI